jgi:hypothetical protein
MPEMAIMGLSENVEFPNTIATNEGEGRYTRTPFSDTPKCHIKWVIYPINIPTGTVGTLPINYI